MSSASPSARYETSLARQQHQNPPKVAETLSSRTVSNGSALDTMCAFLQSEKSKLSHLDLQQHWTDLHGVATALCRHVELQGGGAGEKGDTDDAARRRHAKALEQMMLDVEAVRSGGYEDSTPSGAPSAAPPSSSKHVHFPRCDNDDEDGEAGGDSSINHMINTSEHVTPLQKSKGESGNEKDSKKKKKKKKKEKKEEKKEMKKAAKRERKEAKKKLKKEARKGAKR
jgi:hypothetical protein